MSDIKEKINSFNRTELIECMKLNDEVSFYSELFTDITLHPYFPAFRKKIENLYNNQYKENRFVTTYLGKFSPTVELIETIFSTLSNIFDSQNSNITIDVTGKNEEELKIEMQPYFDYFKNKGWKAVQTLFNSFICVDRKKDGTPYIYNIAPQFVKYIDKNDNNDIEEIIFSFDDEEFYYYTKEFYSVYKKEKEDYYIEIEEDTNTTQYFLHDLGVCPVNKFLDDSLNNNSNYLTKNIVVSQLPDLWRYVKKACELEMSEDFTSSPIKVMPDQGCGYEIQQQTIGISGDVPIITDVQCKGGKLYQNGADIKEGGMPIMDGNTQMLCPVCGIGRHIGAGASIAINHNQAAEDGVDINNFIKFFSPPLDGTNYQKERLQEYYNKIINSTIGTVNPGIALARNEKDIVSGYEVTTKILTQFGVIYAKTIKWSYEIILKLKYADKFQLVNIFLGNKFYLLTKEELLSAKKEATNPIQIAELDQELLKLEYKHDPNKYKELSKIYEQMPYSGISDLDFLELIKKGGIVSEFDIEKRLNIIYYIQEFERIKLNSPEILDYNYINKTINELVTNKIKENGTNKVEGTTV